MSKTFISLRDSLKTNFFVLGVLFASLSVSTQVLDFSLVPRFIALALVVIILLLQQSKQENLKLNFNFIIFIYFVYSLYPLLSSFWAVNEAEALFDSCRQLLGFSIFISAYNLFNKDEKKLLQGLKYTSSIIGIVIIAVAFFQFLKIGSINKELSYGVTALSGHKNLFASFLFLLLFWMTFQITNGNKLFLRISLLLIFLIGICFLYLRTKAVFIGIAGGLAITIILFFLKKIKLKINPVLLIVLLCLLSFVCIDYVLPKIIQTSIASVVNSVNSQAVNIDLERLQLWDKSYAIHKARPLLGVGAGNWQIYFPNAGLDGIWRAEDLNVTFQRPHNDVLWILTEYGLIGMCLFLVVIFEIVVKLTKQAQSLSDYLPIMFLVGYLIISFFDFPKERIEHTIFFNLLLGYSVYKISAHSKTISISLTKPKKLIYFGIAIYFQIFVIGVLRYKGEYFTRKIYDAKFSNNPTDVIKYSKSALSFAYSLDPTSVPIYWYLANAAQTNQLKDVAFKSFLKAYSENPYNRNVLNDLGSAYAYQNKIEEAIKFYNEAIRISPRFDEPKLNLAALYIQKNDFKMAHKILRELKHDSGRRTEYEKIVALFFKPN